MRKRSSASRLQSSGAASSLRGCFRGSLWELPSIKVASLSVQALDQSTVEATQRSGPTLKNRQPCAENGAVEQGDNRSKEEGPRDWLVSFIERGAVEKEVVLNS